MDEWYLQDKRSYSGNAVMWWAKDKKGYTSDLNKAHVFTEEEAFAQAKERDTDVPWAKEYIDLHTQRTCDMQYIKKKESDEFITR